MDNAHERGVAARVDRSGREERAQMKKNASMEEGRLLEIMFNDNAEALRHLLDSGLDPNHILYGERILRYVVRFRRRECVRLLLKRNADPNATTELYGVPLVCAIVEDKPDMARLLIEAKANAHAMDNDGWSSLHYAACWNRPWFVQHYIPLMPRDCLTAVAVGTDGSPLDVACRNESRACALVMIAAGANFHFDRASWSGKYRVEFEDAIRGRERCRAAARFLFGILKHRVRTGRDTAGLVVCALWTTRMNEAWQHASIEADVKSARK
jgi:hypothetical protein